MGTVTEIFAHRAGAQNTDTAEAMFRSVMALPRHDVHRLATQNMRAGSGHLVTLAARYAAAWNDRNEPAAASASYLFGAAVNAASATDRAGCMQAARDMLAQ